LLTAGDKLNRSISLESVFYLALPGLRLMARLLLRRGSFARQGSIAKKTEKVLNKNLMKALTTKELVSLAVIAITASVLALAIVIAARIMAAAGNELLLLALTLCGAVVNGINGFGRRTVKVESQSRRSRRGPQSSVALSS